MFAELYRSPRLVDCEQRAFILHAVGIPYEIVPQLDGYALVVAAHSHAAALEHLQRYEAEARNAPAPPPADPLLPKAWVGSVGYAFAMIAIAYLAGIDWLNQNWRDAGALSAEVVGSGEWWRLVTALTLHADIGHLLANLAFGILFGFFAGQMLGAGIAWLLVLAAATSGNLLDSLLMPPGQRSIGASTAVFATLGLVAALSWQRRAHDRMKWAHRFAPLIAGVALLAFTGAGGENTDVVAHATGFISGIALGAVCARWPVERFANPRLQWLAGAATIAIIAFAWVMALG
jgi:membrane associated rhomboid family serine protease